MGLEAWTPSAGPPPLQAIFLGGCFTLLLALGLAQVGRQGRVRRWWSAGRDAWPGSWKGPPAPPLWKIVCAARHSPGQLNVALVASPRLLQVF